MSINTCRTCGKVETNEMKAFITDEVCENVTYQEQLEHIIGIKLKDENEFPQKICDLCKNHLELITNLSVIWKENERALNAPSSCQTPTASTSRATTPTQDVGEILETPKIKRKRCKVILYSMNLTSKSSIYTNFRVKVMIIHSFFMRKIVKECRVHCKRRQK